MEWQHSFELKVLQVIYLSCPISNACNTTEENRKQLSDRNINLLPKDTLQMFTTACVVTVYHAQYAL